LTRYEGVGISEELGAALVVVDAKDERASAFYQRHGFEPLTDQPSRLIARMTDVRAIVPE
jgi:ribosomal protein S18 acetylase RimI-like enzyme